MGIYFLAFLLITSSRLQNYTTYILFQLQGVGICGGNSLQQTPENCFQSSKTSQKMLIIEKCNDKKRKKIEDYRNEYSNSFGIILSYNHLIQSIQFSLHSFINLDRFYYFLDLKPPITSGRTMQEAIYSWIYGEFKQQSRSCKMTQQLLCHSDHISFIINLLLGPMKIFLLAAVFFVLISADPVYKKIIHNVDPEAKCLDGSPAALYLHQGDPKNILIYFIGGADCAGSDLGSTLEHCYQRSKSMYGSSLYWPETKVGEGILSTNENKNIFANWTKAILLYCDGAFHQGNTKAPYSYKDAKLYFRGGVNTRAHFQYLQNRFDLAKAEKVVLTGSSAGGIATYVWVDYLKGFIANPEVKLFSIVDSGIFLDPSQQLGFNLREAESDQQILYKVSNKDEGVPNRVCAVNQPADKQWSCLTTQGAIPYLGVESLFLQSAYDHYIIYYGGNVRCCTEGISGYSLADCQEADMQIIEGYRNYYMKYLTKITGLGHNVWSISCAWHAVALYDEFYQSPLQKVPMEKGFTMQEAIYKYVFEGGKVLDIDVEPWPANTPCAY